MSPVAGHPSQDPLVGMTLGGCRLLSILGRGGMGTVYKAHHIALDKPVALKLLAAHLAGDPEFVARFVREAQAAARIEHPNVVHVLNVAAENEQHFIVMQFIDGESLQEVLERNGRLEADKATRIARDVAAGLEALHAQGIVHRDIKPANILLSRDGSVKITDFGLARNLKIQSGMTSAGVFMGTPEFVSPEQVNGPAVDHRGDLYSLGVTYYYMLSGELPFKAMNAVEMATQHLKAEPTPLESIVPGIDQRAVEIVRRLLQKDPAKRYQDAGDLVAALQSMLVNESPAAASARAAAQATAKRAPPSPPAPAEVPEIQIKGRRMPPPAPAAPPPEADAVPEISAGPKKRVIQGGPVVPREIVPIPPPPPRPGSGPSSDDPEPNRRVLPKADPAPPTRRMDTPKEESRRIEPPAVSRAEPPAVEAPPPMPEPPAPPPASRPVAPAAPPKPAPRASGPRRVGPLFVYLRFWFLVLAGSAMLFSASVLGAEFRSIGGFWDGLLDPILHNDAGRYLRWGLVAGGIAAYIVALLSIKMQISDSQFPAPIIFLPIFAGLCFYAAGLMAPVPAGEGLVPVRGLRGAAESLRHPVLLAPVAVWLLLAGLAMGMRREAGGLARTVAVLSILGSLGAAFLFAAAGNWRVVHEPGRQPMMASGILLVAVVGMILCFRVRSAPLGKAIGLVVVLLAMVSAYGFGIPGAKPDNLRLAEPWARFLPLLVEHGLALFLGIFLLYWGGWFLHRKA